MSGALRRPVLVAGIALASLAAIAIYVGSRPAERPTALEETPDADAEGALDRVSSSSSGELRTSSAPPDAGRPAPTGPSGAPITAEDLVGLTVAEQAALLGDTDLSDGLDIPPPLIGTEPSPPLPDRPAADPDYVLGQREAGLHLLDTTLERLSHDADERERDGDADGARRLRVRIERMTALRARRASELETLRAGGSLPSTDPEDRAAEEAREQSPAAGP